MGERGTRPRPTALRNTPGTIRKDRRNPTEPLPTRGPVSPPDWLGPQARAVWDRLAPDLERQGVLTPWDSGLLAFHCRLEVLLVENLRLLEAGPLVKGRRDGLVTNPAWRMFRDGLREYIRTCRELGLTPSARFALRGIDLAADVRDDDPEDTG